MIQIKSPKNDEPMVFDIGRISSGGKYKRKEKEIAHIEWIKWRGRFREKESKP
jgi:hypothetical protein